MSKELDLMIKLEALMEENISDFTDEELERVMDWFNSKYDREDKEEDAPANPFIMRRERRVITPSPLPQQEEDQTEPGTTIPQQPALPIIIPGPDTNSAPWQIYQTWCSDNCGEGWSVTDYYYDTRG